jgi:hypothetical protein
MSRLQVMDITVPILLEQLRKKEWVVPIFQREFVWTTADVTRLVNSIIDSRPIGMATLWQRTNSPLAEAEVETEPVWIPDPEAEDGRLHLAGSTQTPSTQYAILDGRQRCTAVAVAFGGLRAQGPRARFAGRFFLDVATKDRNERVVFKKEAEVRKDGLAADATCIGRGLFPLSTSQPGEEVLAQWMRYVQQLKSSDNYANGQLPSTEELDRRDRTLKAAFDGIINTKLAVYIVPESYDLASICDIFETLNQTGTIVSTVDLIHSWLYADTRNDAKPIILREWIQEFGQIDGAIGWSSVEKRPELVAQIVTACYVAATSKPTARKVAGSGVAPVSSVKSKDLLATPTGHWRTIVENTDSLAKFLGDFQRVVAGGPFPFTMSPYPISGAIYVGLRWHFHFDQPAGWGRDDLDPLYRAFFWRNALSSRYDQGFLTQLGADIKELKAILEKRSNFDSANKWAEEATKSLDMLMGPFTVTKETLIDLLTDGRQTGALQQALTLPMLAGAHKDLLDPQVNIGFPNGETPELHHIFPKAWCASNKSGNLAKLLDKKAAGRDWVDSIANMMPLSRKSNNIWKAKIPDQILAEQQAHFATIKAAAKGVYIDEKAFELLTEGSSRIEDFWMRRANLIATDLLGRTTVTL